MFCCSFLGEKNGFYGRKHSIETITKISQKNKGKKLSEETKMKLKGRVPWNKGKKIQGHPQTEETKNKIRLKRLAYWKRIKLQNPT